MPRFVALLLVALAACGRSTPKVQTRAEKGDVAIVGGTVIPMDQEGTLADYTVLLRGDTIVAVAPDRAIDVKDARVIDAKGAWVLPGLADMHVHFWTQGDLTLFLLNGVTTVRNLFGSPEHLRWRDAIARGELDGPTILTAGPIIDGDPPTWPGSAIAMTADAARAVVEAQQQAGYDWLKVYNGLPAEAYDAILDEAAKVNLPVAGHVPKAVGIEKAITSGQKTIEHLDGYVPFFGEPPSVDLVAATVRSGVWNCPTLVVTDNFGKLDHPEQLASMRGVDLVSASVREQWNPRNDFRLQTMPALPTEGTAPVTASYDILLSDQLVGAERVVISRLDGGALAVHGQALYVAPVASKMTYRSTKDALDFTTDALSPPHVVVTRTGATASAVQDGKPAVEAPAAADAVLAPQAIAEFVWYASMLGDLEVGKRRTVTAVEVIAEQALRLDPGTFTMTRAPDADGRRVYAVTGKTGKLDLKGTFTVDADGAPHEVSLTLVFGTFVMRRR